MQNMFTQDQINFINQLIDDRIAHHAQSERKKSRMRDFHTINDIRDLILSNLEEFRAFCCGDEFHIATLTSFLKLKQNSPHTTKSRCHKARQATT
jgi:glutathione S-transferase